MRTKRSLIKVLMVSLTICLSLALSAFFGGAKIINADSSSVEIAGQVVDISSFETYAGASIRYDSENKGIRFVTGIDATKYEELNTLAEQNGYKVTYGAIITYTLRAQKLIDAGKDFTKEDLDALEVEGSKYIDFTAKVFSEKVIKQGNVEYTAVLGVSETNYNYEMSARGYVKVSKGDNENIYYASYPVENGKLSGRSAQGVSHTLLEDFVGHGVDSDVELSAIAEYTKNEVEDGYYMPNATSMSTYAGNTDNYSIETNQSIGGRSGVSKYTLKTSAQTWNERLMPTFMNQNTTWEGTNPNAVGHEKSVKRQTTMGFKYLVFDIYLQDAFTLYFPTVNRKHAYVKVATSGNLVYYRYNAETGSNVITTDTEITDKAKIYNAGGTEQLTATYSGIWYTVVVDISANIGLGYNSACDVSLSFTGTNVGVYYDNVRFYRTNAWEQDIVKGSIKMDTSEFGIMYDGGSISKFEVGSMGGRDSVNLFYEQNPATKSKAGFMFTNNWDANKNNISTTAHNRVKASGIKYISFDICRAKNAPVTLYLWDNQHVNDKAPTNKSAPFTIVYNTGKIDKCPSNVKLFNMSGETTDTMVENVWYTIVIEVQYETGNNNWPAIHFSGAWVNIGIDNIVYYYNDVPELWK